MKLFQLLLLLCFVWVGYQTSFAETSSATKADQSTVTNWQWSCEVTQNTDLLSKPDKSKIEKAQKEAKTVCEKLKRKVQKECGVTLYDNPPFAGTIHVIVAIGGASPYVLDATFGNRAKDVSKVVQEGKSIPIEEGNVKNYPAREKNRSAEIQEIVVLVTDLLGNQGEHRIRKSNNENISHNFDDLIKSVKQSISLYGGNSESKD